MLILLAILLIYLFVGEPIARWLSFKRLIRNMNATPRARLYHYFENIIRYWLLSAYILIILLYNGFKLSVLGFQPASWSHMLQQPLWLKILLIVVSTGYFIYYYYFPIILSRFNQKMRIKVAEKIKGVKYIAPINAMESFWWCIYSLNGIAEEIIYRGFIFFLLGFLFPNIHIVWVMAASALAESWRFIPRYSVVMNVLFTGVFYSVLYICFRSIYPIAIIHIIQYLKVFFLPFDPTPQQKTV